MATASAGKIDESCKPPTCEEFEVEVKIKVEDDLTPLPPPAHLNSTPAASRNITPLVERRGSRIIQEWTKRRINKWRSPSLMVLFFLLGLSISIAHCVFYPKLRGKLVGDSNQQEEKIRYCFFLW
jgi:thiol:disulfide interchange protein